MLVNKVDLYVNKTKYYGWPYGKENDKTPVMNSTIKKDAEDFCKLFTLQKLQNIINNEVDLELLPSTPVLSVEDNKYDTWNITTFFADEAVLKLLAENKSLNKVIDFLQYVKIRFAIENGLEEYHHEDSSTIVHPNDDMKILVELFPLEYKWVYDDIVIGKE